MKKFQFAAGLAALALLGACSSDAPEVTGQPGEVVDEGTMYISIKIADDSETRAQNSVLAGARESEFKNISLIVFDNFEKPVLATKTTEIVADGTNKKATFKIPYQSYTDLESLVGKNCKVVVIANSPYNYANSTIDILHDEYDGATWGVETKKGINTIGDVSAVGAGDNTYFMMSNAEVCHALMTNVKRGEGDSAVKYTGKEDDPWQIAADVQLSRLCTRFEYGTDNKDNYSALNDTKLKMTIEGMAVDTHANKAYYLATFSENGLMPTNPTIVYQDDGKTVDASKSNHCHYAKCDEFPYRVTTKFPSASCSDFGSMNYGYLNKGHLYTYDHPNTVSTDFTFVSNVNDANYKNNFEKLPYAAIKVKFECTDFAGQGWPSVSQEKGEEVLAVGGVFVGGVSDYLKLKTAYKEAEEADKESKKFKVVYSTTDGDLTRDEIEAIEKVVEQYNTLLTSPTSLAPSEKNDNLTRGCEEDQKWWRDNFQSKDVYSPVSVTENEVTTHSYYTYYSQLIVNDDSSTAIQDKYGVSRNTTYALAVKSIKFLGATGDKVPGQGPSDADFTEMYINLTCTVNNWATNFKNTGWKL